VRLEGKVAVVVGAGQSPGKGVGIGRASALTLAREGASVLLVDRRRHSAEETRAMVAGAGGKAAVHAADVTSEDDCRALAAAAATAFGRIDVLVNAVGIHGPGAATEVDEAVWDLVLDTNLKAMWLTAKHVLPAMIDQRGGSIVNVSSIGAVRGGSALPYGVSKAGVNRLTIALAAAYAHLDIRANAVLPGLVETPMAIDVPLRGRDQGQPGDREAVVTERAAKVPMAYRGTAWDVANAVLFLASDESRYVTGVLLPVDGGLLASR
jgi:NAD(P)-dependent dehydrogenase (short-subunit alcohol dehydrogenase family)